MESFAIQEWLFTEARGRFSIDLGESGTQFQYAKVLSLDPTWDLDYSVDRGDEKLRERVHSMYSAADSSDVIITVGGQESLYLYYCSVLQPGDGVVVTYPGWQQAWSVPEWLGADVQAVKITGQDDSSEIANRVISQLTPNVRVAVLTNPNNPLGTKIQRNDIVRIADAADRNGTQLLVDEEYITDYATSAVTLGANVTVVSGLSKVHGVPALRIGWALGPAHIIDRMVNHRRFSTVANSKLSERFALQVLERHEEYIDRYKNMSAVGFDVLDDELGADDRFVIVPPHGTPFTWVEIRGIESSFEFARHLLRRYETLVMPAEVFRSESTAIRITHARDEGTLLQGLTNVKAALGTLGNLRTEPAERVRT